MKKILVLILLFSSCENDNYHKQYFKNGNLKEKYTLNDLGEKDGEYYLYYENGQIQEKSTYSNGQVHGKSVNYYSIGEIELISTFKNGMLDGKQNLYGKNGDLEMIQIYRDDTLEVDKRYHINGKVESLKSFISFLDENHNINSILQLDEKGKVSGYSKYADWSIKENNLQISLEKGFKKDSILIEVVTDYKSMNRIREITFTNKNIINLKLKPTDYINNRLNLVIHDYQKDETIEIEGVKTKLVGHWEKYFIQIDLGEKPKKYNLDYIIW